MSLDSSVRYLFTSSEYIDKICPLLEDADDEILRMCLTLIGNAAITGFLSFAVFLGYMFKFSTLSLYFQP